MQPAGPGAPMRVPRTRLKTPPEPPKLVGFNFLLVLLGVNAAVGGFLFGYDTGSMSAALLQVKRPRAPGALCPGLADHRLSALEQELVISFVVLGAVLGSVLSGVLSGRFGRRRMLLASAVCFAAGEISMALVRGVGAMLIARIIVGLGVGISSHTVPLYIAECAPPHLRGSFCFLNDLMITVGQVVAAFVATEFFYAEVPGGWRWILGVACVPSTLMFAGFFFMPESPRWLILQGRRAEAKEVMRSLRRPVTQQELEDEFQDAVQISGEEQPLTAASSSHGVTSFYSWYLKDPRVRRALMLGCGLQCLQQWAGINTIVYYGASVLQKASGNPTSSCFSPQSKADVGLTVLFGSGQLIGVFFSWLLVDRWGRRPLMLCSLLGVIASLVATGFMFSSEQVSESAVVACVMVYLACFGAGLSPVPWTVNAEIYPLHARAQCISVSTCTNWIMNFVVSQTFLSLARALSTDREHPSRHPNGVFWLYAGISAVGLLCVWLRMPETKGLSLEQMGDLFVDADPALGLAKWAAPPP